MAELWELQQIILIHHHGGYQMIPNSGFDGAENDFIFFTGSFLTSGSMTYKIYG